MKLMRPLTPFPIFAVLAVGACGDHGRPAGPPPPRAEFLVAAGDSTYWVRSTSDGIRRRGSSMMLARVAGELYEVYTADEDRSFYDALFVGQRVYRRNLVSGDSALVYRDTIVPAAGRHWAEIHPEDSPLLPEEEVSEHPVATATADVELLDVHGAYLSIEHHTDIDVGGVRHMHRTVRRVVDLRSRRDATLRQTFGDSAGRAIIGYGAALYAAARDSIRDTRDPRAARARDAAIDLAFDPRSYSLSEIDGRPAVTFMVPGIGEHTAGTALPLAPIAASSPSWWSAVVPTLPSSSDSVEDRWAGRGYSVSARYDAAGESAALSLADKGGREWPLGRIAVPVRRVLWLDAPPLDSLHREALARAFDDAVLYDDNARLAGRANQRGAVSRVALVRGSRGSRKLAPRPPKPIVVPVSRRAHRPRAKRSRHSPT